MTALHSTPCGHHPRPKKVSAALFAYIEKAFLQTGLQPMERDVTRDLWLKNPTQPLTKDNMQIYYIGKLVRSQKEHSDWFFERSQFC